MSWHFSLAVYNADTGKLLSANRFLPISVRYARIGVSLQPRQLKAVTSLDIAELDDLASVFDKEWKKSEKSRLALRTGKRRLRALGAGRNAILRSSREKLIFILFWFKVYPTFDVMSFFFGMSQPQACLWAHRLAPILEAALGKKLCLPERKAHNLTKTLAEFPSLTIIVDGTERPCCRPTNGMKRKACYSGRKKRYAIKNILGVHEKRVVLLGQTRPGRWHDKKCIDVENWRFPRGSTIVGDRGFAGYEQNHADVRTPERRPNHGKTLKRNRPFNKRLARKRIVVEHAIAGVKRSHIIADILRTRKPDFPDKAMLIACALHNFRVDSRIAA